jgi:hypothetical protein
VNADTTARLLSISLKGPRNGGAAITLLLPWLLHPPTTAMVLNTSGNQSGYRGNRSYRSEPVAVPVGSQGIQFKIFKFEFQKLKNVKKSKNTSRFIESNSVKIFQILVHLIFFVGVRSSTKKNEQKLGRLNFYHPQKILNLLIFAKF